MEAVDFEWDAGNLAEIGKHGLRAVEVQDAIRNPGSQIFAAYAHGDEARAGVVGATNGGGVSSERTCPALVQGAGTMTAHRERKLDKDAQTGRAFIDSTEDIPVFASDEDELEFWRTHEPSPKLLKHATHMTPEELLLSTRDLPQR
jgi:hypothetical protein